MARYRDRLPQLDGGLFLTDGGIETTLIYLDRLELPCFASFTLLRDEAGRQALRRYFATHASIARSHGVGFILESATWRASADWGARLGYSPLALDEANRQAIDLLHELREEFETPESPMVVSGCIGPRGDGYDAGQAMSADEAERYHARQTALFAERDVDMITAITMTNRNEAVGVTRAARAAGLPVAISFTVETDGRLPTGEPLGEAIEAVDQATGSAPAYYMINCAHPSHYEHELASGGAWVARVRGMRANASQLSHAELDAAVELHAGDPVDLGRRYARLHAQFPGINVLGGCCGTDHRHIERIASEGVKSWHATFARGVVSHAKT